jgi:hypothetical protein
MACVREVEAKAKQRTSISPDQNTGYKLLVAGYCARVIYLHSIANDDVVVLVRQDVLDPRHFTCLLNVSTSTLLCERFACIYPDNNAKQRCVDAGNDGSETLLARGPVPCNWLPAMVSSQVKGMVVSLVSYRQLIAICMGWCIFFVNRDFALTYAGREVSVSGTRPGSMFMVMSTTVSIDSHRRIFVVMTRTAARMISSNRPKHKVYMISCSCSNRLWWEEAQVTLRVQPCSSPFSRVAQRRRRGRPRTRWLCLSGICPVERRRVSQ